MYSLRVKICGIKDKEIAGCAVESGTDALGFVFYDKSPRFIEPSAAGDIIKGLPPFVNKTGVFVDKTMEEILAVVEKSGIDTIQLHGESEIYDGPFIQKLSLASRLPVILARRVEEINGETLSGIRKEWGDNKISAFLIDRLDRAEYGGTGRPAVWQEITDKGLKKFIRERIIIAGGINSGNISGLLNKINPYGVDVSSGVEKEKGVKDKILIQKFMAKVKHAMSNCQQEDEVIGLY